MSQNLNAEWLDLKALQQYACVSERTIRGWIHRSANPLPATQVGKKILIRRGAFDAWMETQSVKAVDIERIVEDLITGVTR